MYKDKNGNTDFEAAFQDVKEKIRIAENVREIREVGVGDQLPLFQEAL